MRSFLVIFVFLFSCSENKRTQKISAMTMGTTYNITYINNSMMSGKDIESKIKDILYRIDKVEMSTWEKTSELSRFNLSKNTEEQFISPSLYKVISKAQEISQLTDGAFDVTVMPLVNLWGFGWKGRVKSSISEEKIDSIRPIVGYQNLILDNGKLKKKNANTMVDLSAIAKGFAVDEVSEYLNEIGITNYLVEIGGEVRAKGLNEKNMEWRIGIDKPSLNISSQKELQEILSISGWSLATSGDYRNFYIKDNKRLSHTINPKSMRPVEHQLGSVTVLAKDCMTADALATACMVLGKEKSLELINSLTDVEAMFIERVKEGSYKDTYTENFEKFIYKTKKAVN